MRKLIKNRKGALEELQNLIIPLVAIAIVLVVGFLILAEMKTQATKIEGALSYSENATGEVQMALEDIPGWLPIIVIVIIGALLIGLVSYFRRT